ncbi:MAG: chromosomal replication initiator protein DnaA [Candidatus Pelagibacterales bacterium]|nr:MAG: chromosomal replication initiator protein DnaA [Pelagibacterales bacterium]
MPKINSKIEIHNNNSSKIDWEKVSEDIKIKLGNDIFNSWIQKLKLVEEMDHYIVLSAPTRFIRDWVVSRYLDQIIKIVKIYKNNISRIDFMIEKSLTSKVDKEIDEKNINSNVSYIEESELAYTRIDPNKNFKNFVVGPSNSLAFEACKKVCDQISNYNPLFLYSGIGMGKTHLLNSIGLELKKNKKVMFISAERFMYQFVKSLKRNEMVKFKDFFRNTDVFIIDDIQFVSGKEVMQEEFFHTFNALIEKGSQVIISSDRPPAKLTKIQERIKSRLSGGLVIDIQESNLDLRLKILKTKLNEIKNSFTETIEPEESIVNFIASEIRISNRELIGALNRIISFSRIYKKSPSFSEAKIILKDLLNISENKITIENIQKIVCSNYKISKNEMLSPRRSRYLVRPRQIAMYLAKNLTSKSLPDIGREFSNRDHTTVIHSVKIINKLKLIDGDLSKNLEKLKNDILYKNQNEI